MIISFLCWLIGMNVLKDYGWEFKESLMVWCVLSAVVEWIFYFIILFISLGIGP